MRMNKSNFIRRVGSRSQLTHLGGFSNTSDCHTETRRPLAFSRVMDSLLKIIPNTMVYLGHVLVTGPTDDEHLRTLDRVLERLVQAGFCMEESKCQFMSSEVEYPIQRIDEKGIHAAGDALTAVRDAPAPVNVPELRSYLGIVNHYGRFLPNLATTLTPMHQLLKGDTK